MFGGNVINEFKKRGWLKGTKFERDKKAFINELYNSLEQYNGTKPLSKDQLERIEKTLALILELRKKHELHLPDYVIVKVLMTAIKPEPPSDGGEPVTNLKAVG